MIRTDLNVKVVYLNAMTQSVNKYLENYTFTRDIVE